VWFVLVAADAAQIVNVTSELVLSADSPATLECVVRANPVHVAGLVTWYRVTHPDVQLAGATAEVLAGSMLTSTLVIGRVSRGDVGLYRCVAFNGLGVPVNATVNVVVRALRAYLSLTCGDNNTTTTTTTTTKLMLMTTMSSGGSRNWW